MTTRMRTRKRTTTGSRAAAFLLLVISAALPVLTAAPAQPLYFKKDKPKKSSQPQPAFGVIAGTVFRPPGFALPGAEVVITPQSDPPAGIKISKQRAISDARGEFAVRVPAVPMKYLVNVKSSGFVEQQKAVQIEGEQRKELTFELEPARE
jgi:hypothetical protein